MSLLGHAALVSFHDMVDGAEGAHDDWHSHQHMDERVTIPGFRRGRRCRGLDGGPKFLIVYEVDDLEVLKSDAYQARLNSPTDWTQRTVPTIRNMSRTLCRVLASRGNGVGVYLLSVRLRCDEQRRGALIERLSDEALPEFARRPGIVAAHLLEGDAEASGVKNDEMRLRGDDAPAADLVLLVEGYELESLRKLAANSLGDEPLTNLGAERIQRGLHQLAHLVSELDCNL